MKKRILILGCCILGLGATTLFAQQGNNTAGGNASGTGGTASFSIGQTFYSSPSSTSYNIVQGLQQPYEISVITSVEEKAKEINLSASVFPNPTIDNFTLKVENSKNKNITYSLHDVSGKLITSNKVEADETQIEVSHMATSYYILKVYEGNQEIKSFKIIKYY